MRKESPEQQKNVCLSFEMSDQRAFGEYFTNTSTLKPFFQKNHSLLICGSFVILTMFFVWPQLYLSISMLLHLVQSVSECLLRTDALAGTCYADIYPLSFILSFRCFSQRCVSQYTYVVFIEVRDQKTLANTPHI